MRWRWWIAVVLPLALATIVAGGRAGLAAACLGAAASMVLVVDVARARARRFPEEAQAMAWMVAGFGLLAARWLGSAAAGLAGVDPPRPVMLLALLGNLAIVWGQLQWPIAPRRTGERLRAAAEAAAGALAILCLQWLLVGPALGPRPAVILAPLFLNSLNLGITIYLVGRFPARYLGPLGFVFLAALSATVGNLMLLRAPDVAGVRLMACLAALSAAHGLALPRPISATRASRAVELAGGFVPYLLGLLLLAGLLYRHLTDPIDDLAILWLVYPLVGLYLLRQVFALADLQRLSRRLETQVEERSRALAAAQEELAGRHRLESLGRLAGGVAHDFNNLLAGIAGYAHLLGRRAPAGAAFLPHVEHIQRAVERGAGLTRQILTFARRQPGEPQVLDPAGVLAELQRLLTGVVGERVELSLEAPAGLGFVRVDPGQLEQVVVNLAARARQSMPAGGHLRVALAAVHVDERAAHRHEVEPGRYLTIAIADDGAGLTASALARVFEPFQEHGDGLGLAASYGIVRQAGGFFQVESEPGCGSRFVLHLPAVAPVVAPAPEPARATGRCVLVVDDSPALRTSLAAGLREHGYEVLVADGGEAALAVLHGHEGRVDALVTDVRMPGMGGVETARAACSLRPGLRGVLMSGFSDVAEDQLPRDLPLIGKPFAPPQLAELLDRLLSDR